MNGFVLSRSDRKQQESFVLLRRCSPTNDDDDNYNDNTEAILLNDYEDCGRSDHSGA
jgi:hypothetical protein